MGLALVPMAKTTMSVSSSKALPGTGIDADRFWQGLANAVMGQLYPYLLECSQRVHAPAQRARHRAAPVADGGAALCVFHPAGRVVVAPGRGGEAPGLAAAAVLQQPPFGRRVGHRVVGPRGELVEAAVAGPGVATAAVRHQAAEVGVGQHVAPGARGGVR